MLQLSLEVRKYAEGKRVEIGATVAGEGGPAIYEVSEVDYKALVGRVFSELVKGDIVFGLLRSLRLLRVFD